MFTPSSGPPDATMAHFDAYFNFLQAGADPKSAETEEGGFPPSATIDTVVSEIAQALFSPDSKALAGSPEMDVSDLHDPSDPSLSEAASVQDLVADSLPLTGAAASPPSTPQDSIVVHSDHPVEETGGDLTSRPTKMRRGRASRDTKTRQRIRKRCPEDGIDFPREAMLRDHIRECHPRGFKCLHEHCQSGIEFFQSAKALLRHQQLAHGINANGRKAPNYLCGHCDSPPHYARILVLNHLHSKHSTKFPKPRQNYVSRMSGYVIETENPERTNTIVFTLKPEFLRA